MNFAINRPRFTSARVTAIAAAFAALLALGPVTDADARPHLKRIGNFNSPTYITSAPGDTRRLFVTERSGVIRVMRDGRTLRRPFLRIPDVSTDGERGLLSLAFAPDYQRSRLFYVFYTGPDGTIRIDEFKRSARSPNRARRATRRAVLRIPHPRSNHNGGQLQFGPDGMLYISVGDGGGENDPGGNAQDRTTLLGKLLRINPRRGNGRAYQIPAGNPFAGPTPGRAEIYHYGLRNPYRFSFDRASGAMVIGDVGQARREEIDFRLRRQPGGANFGWDCFEGTLFHEGGTSCLEGGPHVEPVFEYEHVDGNCSITGGYVARHRSLRRLRGEYLYADYCAGRIRALSVGSDGTVGDRPTPLVVANPVSFGEGHRGRLYVVAQNSAIFNIRG